jgi:membrane protease YdiL (CAAX protease family)
MAPKGRVRAVVVALAVSAVVFVAASIVADAILRGAGRPDACVPRFALTYLILAVLCLGLARARHVDLGFRRCSLRALVAPALPGLLVGGVASGLALAVGFVMPGCVGELSLLQLVVLTWVMASLAEELLTRGLLQGLLSDPTEKPAAGAGLHWSVVASATFFAAMHLPLLTVTANWRGVAILVAFAFALGLLAGHARRVTGSLWPAVAVHSSFNIAGTVLGVVAQIFNEGAL